MRLWSWLAVGKVTNFRKSEPCLPRGLCRLLLAAGKLPCPWCLYAEHNLRDETVGHKERGLHAWLVSTTCQHCTVGDGWHALVSCIRACLIMAFNLHLVP